MKRTVTVERDIAALERIVPEWEALAAAAAEPNPFFEPWLLIPALSAFAALDDVRIVCVRHDGVLCGLFPLQVVRRYKGFPVKRLVTWQHPHALLGTPLIARDRARECLQTLIEWFGKERIAAFLELCYVPAGGPFHQALVAALNDKEGIALAGDTYARGMLQAHEDAEAYFSSTLSADSRQKLRRAERRLAEQGTVTHRVLRHGDDIQSWINEFLQVEASGWKGASGSAMACSETNRRFVTEAFSRAYERGRLVMVGIDLDGRPIARYSGFLAGDGAFAFKTAYDEAFRRFSPGLLAEVDMIRAFYALPGMRWMDSLAGHSNSTVDRLWKHRRIVQRIRVATGAWGEFVVLVLLPALQWSKRRLEGLRRPKQENEAKGEAASRPAAARDEGVSRGGGLGVSPPVRRM